MFKNILIVAIVAVLALLGVVAGYRYLRPANVNSTTGPANGKSDDGSKVHALGRIEPESGLIDVGGMAGDRLGHFEVEVGADVKKNDTLAILESHDLRVAEKRAAQTQLTEAQMRQAAEEKYGDAQLEEAQVALDQLEVERLGVEAQRAKIPLLKANLTLAVSDQRRFQALDRSIISQQEMEQQDLRVQQAETELESATKQLTKLEAGLALNKRLAQAKHCTAKAAMERIKAASMLASLERNVELADERLKMTVIRAPIDGRVLKILVQPGETIGPKPILKIGNIQQMAVIAEVYENDVRRVAEGQAVKCTSQALKSPLNGKVKHIGATVAKNEVNSLDPIESGDTRVVEVRIELDPSDKVASKEAASLVNLQVDVEITTNSKPGASP